MAVVVVGDRRMLVTSPIPGIQPDEPRLRARRGGRARLRSRRARRAHPRIAPVANRLTVASAPSGVLVVDDTYNSNPAGAAAALDAARRRRPSTADASW